MTIYSALWTRWVAVVALTVSGAAFSQNTSPEAAGALLRCDPWTVIKSIDGRPSGVKALQGSAFTDCEIRLSAGAHQLKVCYEARRHEQTGTANVVHVYRCDSDQQVGFVAVAGRIYRVKFNLAPEFSARIEDVTAAESDLPATPTANKSRRLSKTERASTVLVRVVGSGMPVFMPGTTQNLWFKANWKYQAFHGAKGMQPELEGYFSAEFSNGDTLAIRHVRKDGQYAFVCDTEMPVYEDLPGGRVLYLGDYHLESYAEGIRFNVTHDEEAARKFLQTHHPDLAGKLESARFRVLRVPEPCQLVPAGHRLRQAPTS
jgi:hypothetical protein